MEDKNFVTSTAAEHRHPVAVSSPLHACMHEHTQKSSQRFTSKDGIVNGRTPASKQKEAGARRHPPEAAMGIDLKAGGKSKKTKRTAPKSDDIYLKLLVKVRIMFPLLPF